eukprot:TRINITY_DN7073_c0_g1_i1.p1 TRINITY_DN7073_c0_g1~~TRINITY_DN7073_c0_g1_i1.p1  ORF type:complete len:1297 (-),score=340.42 TRINITY_DN7073_c0_g1_i1:11-3901(-)
MSTKRVRFNIDRGGTFTDIYAEVVGEEPPGPGYRIVKVLSEDKSYPNAPREGIRRVLNDVFGLNIGVRDKIPTDKIEWIRMGTTVATNALLERNSNKEYYGDLPAPQKVALVTTQGFRDLLRIGNQSRPKIFDLKCEKPELLYNENYVIEIDERVRIRGDLKPEDVDKSNPKFRVFENGEVIEVQPLPQKGSDSYNKLVEELKKPLSNGVYNVAVLFLHSYIFKDHENEISKLCYELGYKHVSTSSSLMASVKAVARGHTATVDAFLTPYLVSYIEGFKSGFEDTIKDVDVKFMKSDGGLCDVKNFSGYVSILSGPAGGVVGYSQTVSGGSHDHPLEAVGFDMGGTSTDVSRVRGDEYSYVQETELDGVFIQATQLDVNTVAAGGGSVLHYRGGNMSVGPDSVGSDPGPICYGKGGSNLAVTDANFFLGRILQDFFPFKLDYDKVKAKFESVASEINSGHKTSLSPHQVAYGFIELANQKMASAIKKITEAKGFDVTRHVLAVFGGAGPQHACAIAKSLGMTRVQVNRYSSVLSAYGLGLADVKEELLEQCKVDYIFGASILPSINERFSVLEEKTQKKLLETFHPERVVAKKYLNMRYQGTDTILSIERPDDEDYRKIFEREYLREFGFTMPNNNIIVESLKVILLGKAPKITQHKIAKSSQPPKPKLTTKAYFKVSSTQQEFLDSNVYVFSELGAGDTIQGPAFIVDPLYYITIVVEPDCIATISEHGHVEIQIPKLQEKSTSQESGVIKRSLFIHRFMSIAEQMGVALQRTAKSVNIKERLDFSCALFNHTGGLVANAPHLPVHLGAMQHAVKYQIKTVPDWKKGEVILSNHPEAGGSHLPDFTVITPVYYEGEPVDVEIDGEKVDFNKPIFYVASRAHHAEIGGIAPGSMPAFSKRLVEEGAATKSLKIAKEGVFQTEAVLEFLASPAKHSSPSSSIPICGSRKPDDNIDDLKAQIAANKKGIDLVLELIRQYTVSEVLDMMYQVQLAAESAVRHMLKSVAQQRIEEGLPLVLQAVDYMDEGMKIKLKIEINEKTGDALFDFTGTSPEQYGNLNAPVSVTSSAVIYCLRCLVNEEIPLNEGCMTPIKIIIPKESILAPSDGAAVVGGNVLTSQRVTDVILTAFNAQACSQGCMNNFSFGGAGSASYYETIAGGCGAGPTWNGQSAVQCHMTNTRITDPEIFERRFPIKVLEFSIRRNSGGEGVYRGGDGAIRKIQFLKPLTISLLTERRTLAPQGLKGGKPGKRGKNVLIKNYREPNERIIYLGGKNMVPVDAGDVVCIKTPGGGGYGQNTQ